MKSCVRMHFTLSQSSVSAPAYFRQPPLSDLSFEPCLFDQLEEFPAHSDHVVGIANRIAEV
jgi:hypothetical protein